MRALEQENAHRYWCEIIWNDLFSLNKIRSKLGKTLQDSWWWLLALALLDPDATSRQCFTAAAFAALASCAAGLARWRTQQPCRSASEGRGGDDWPSGLKDSAPCCDSFETWNFLFKVGYSTLGYLSMYYIEKVGGESIPTSHAILLFWWKLPIALSCKSFDDSGVWLPLTLAMWPLVS